MPTSRPKLDSRRPTGTYTLSARTTHARTASSSHAVVLQMPSVSSSLAHPEPSQPTVQAENSTPSRALMAPLVAALLVFGLGMGYLSVKAQETVERNRTLNLQRLLKQERETQTVLLNLKAEREHINSIGKKAVALGMVRQTDRPPLTVGHFPDNLPTGISPNRQNSTNSQTDTSTDTSAGNGQQHTEEN